MNTNLLVVKGPTPPLDESALWLSTAKKHLRLSHAPSERRILLRADQSWETRVSEPDAFWNETLGLYCIYYNAGGPLGLATSPSIFGPWTKYQVLANPAVHHSTIVIGSTIYIFYIGSPNTSVKLATAPLSDPSNVTLVGTVLTSAALGTSVEFGNSCVIELNGVYRMYIEYAAPSYGWQMAIAECATIDGTYTYLTAAVSSLQPSFGTGSIVGGTNGVSGMQVFRENGELVAWYHSSDSNEQGSEIYVATSPESDGFNWTIKNNGYPVIRRALPQEVDQAADPCVLELKGGGFEVLFDAYDNASGVCYITAAHLSPQFHEFDGNRWRPIMPSVDQLATGKLIHTQRRIAAYTAVHLDDVPMDPGATANMAFTLPRASVGSRVRVTHMGTGAGTILVGCNASDTILTGSAATLTTGQSATYECFYQGRWSRV